MISDWSVFRWAFFGVGLPSLHLYPAGVQGCSNPLSGLSGSGSSPLLISGLKKSINIREFRPQTPRRDPPPKGPMTLANSLCLGPPFPSKHGKKAQTQRISEGGGVFRGPEILYVEILRVFYLHLIKLWQRRGPRVCGPYRKKLEEPSRVILRAACQQNETAPEKLLNRYEKRFEKRQKGSEKRSETRPKIV